MDIEMIKINARQLVRLIGLEVDLTDSRQNPLDKGILRYVNRGASDIPLGYYVNDKHFSVNEVGVVLRDKEAGGIITLNYSIEREVAA